MPRSLENQAGSWTAVGRLRLDETMNLPCLNCQARTKHTIEEMRWKCTLCGQLMDEDFQLSYGRFGADMGVVGPVILKENPKDGEEPDVFVEGPHGSEPGYFADRFKEKELDP